MGKDLNTLSYKQKDMATKCAKEYLIHSDVEFTKVGIRENLLNCLSIIPIVVLQIGWGA